MTSTEHQNDLAALAGRLREICVSRGWEAAHTTKNLAISLTVEVGELLEHFQWDEVTAADRIRRPDRHGAAAEEIADVAIYTIQLADALGLDLLAEIEAKIEKNLSRFPARAKHAA